MPFAVDGSSELICDDFMAVAFEQLHQLSHQQVPCSRSPAAFFDLPKLLDQSFVLPQFIIYIVIFISFICISFISITIYRALAGGWFSHD